MTSPLIFFFLMVFFSTLSDLSQTLRSTHELNNLILPPDTLRDLYGIVLCCIRVVAHEEPALIHHPRHALSAPLASFLGVPCLALGHARANVLEVGRVAWLDDVVLRKGREKDLS